jgi:hypothetical protein
MPRDREQDKTNAKAQRGGGPKALAASLGGLTRRATGRRGFAEAGLVTAWDSIVGPALAASCWPDRLSFPPGRRDGGTLRIRVTGGFALELQHMQPQLLQRINSHFGYRAIERISILHAPPGDKAAVQRRRPARPTARDVGPEDRAAIESALSQVDDPEIRAVLARLGRAVISDSRGGGEG